LTNSEKVRSLVSTYDITERRADALVVRHHDKSVDEIADIEGLEFQEEDAIDPQDDAWGEENDDD